MKPGQPSRLPTFEVFSDILIYIKRELFSAIYFTFLSTILEGEQNIRKFENVYAKIEHRKLFTL